MGRHIPTASILESLFYNLAYVLPAYMQGLFVKNKFWVSFWSRLHPDPLAVHFVRHLRRKYDSDYLYLYVLASKSLLVLSDDGIRRVLDRSPHVYADAALKRRGMSHFQPNALTISRGEEWEERRAFNESVLQGKGQPHPYGKRFLDIVEGEVSLLLGKAETQITWDDFERLFEHVALQIIFGKAARDDIKLLRLLDRMMHESNRVFMLRKSKHFDPFYERIGGYLASPEDKSLVSLCQHVPSTHRTRIEDQIPHWMFAIKNTVAVNTVRALALIVSFPEAEAKVREELAASDLSSPGDVDRLAYLEGCLQEAMRLWPTTPTLARETVREDTLGEERIPAGTQVMILNSFNHRDEKTHSQANRFQPERWAGNGAKYHFNHFSNGPQVCAGKELALFVAKSTIAHLLSRVQCALERPALNVEDPLPHAFNAYSTRLSIEKRL